MQQRKFILSGGGTGGHIFPAVAIARQLQTDFPGCQIEFMGALGRMEMEKIPAEGFNIIGLPVQGLKRSISLANIKIIWNMYKSFRLAKKHIKNYNPDCVIGTGGYASLAVLYAASKCGVKTLIWEGNGYAGLSNKLLKNKVNIICTGLPGMEKFFPINKIVYTGNPVRDIFLKLPDKKAACEKFGLNPLLPVVFVTGGSLGARSINQAIQNALPILEENSMQLIWQTGKNFTADIRGRKGMFASVFVNNMHEAYAAADLVVSRAGALSIAEICVVGKPAILVPSPNVTDDHQTKNALVLSEKDAAILVNDHQAMDKLSKEIIALLENKEKAEAMRLALATLAKPNATEKIVEEIKKLIA